TTSPVRRGRAFFLHRGDAMARFVCCGLGVLTVLAGLLVSGCGGRDTKDPAEQPGTPPKQPGAQAAQPATVGAGAGKRGVPLEQEERAHAAAAPLLALVKAPPPPQAAVKPAQQPPGALVPLRSAECRWRNGPIKID